MFKNIISFNYIYNTATLSSSNYEKCMNLLILLSYFNIFFLKWWTTFLSSELYLLWVSVIFLFQKDSDSEFKLIV